MFGSKASQTALVSGFFLLGSLACGGTVERRPNQNSNNNSNNNNNNSTNGTSKLSISLEKVFWRTSGSTSGRQELSVQVQIQNGTDQESLALTPAQFVVETQEGSGIIGSLADLGKPDSCPADVLLLAGAKRSCNYVFQIVSGENPVKLKYTATDGRNAEASINACSMQHNSGLCSYALSCFQGSCQQICSEDYPEGICTEANQQCRQGKCIAPCSMQAPDGFCPDGQGVCHLGQCSLSCQGPTQATSRDCLSCVQQLCPEGNCYSESCNSCVGCGLTKGNYCSCEESCGIRCYTELQSLVANMKRDCPVCFQ